jgi:hypothetical protein
MIDNFPFFEKRTFNVFRKNNLYIIFFHYRTNRDKIHSLVRYVQYIFQHSNIRLVVNKCSEGHISSCFNIKTFFMNSFGSLALGNFFKTTKCSCITWHVAPESIYNSHHLFLWFP